MSNSPIGGGSVPLDRHVRGQLDLAATRELDVHRLVLSVGAEQAEVHRKPASGADHLLDDRPPEDDLSGADVVVDALDLLYAVDEDRERRFRAARQLRPPADRPPPLPDGRPPRAQTRASP